MKFNSIFILLFFLPLFSFGQPNTKTTVDSTKCYSHFDTLANRQIYILVDSMPKFPGGNKAMLDFISKNIKYHHGDCFTGTVFVSFIVESNGQLTNKKIKKGITKYADNEALELIDKMPNWIAGTCNGELVPVEMIIPIRFMLR